jgi:hypothetical protein
MVQLPYLLVWPFFMKTIRAIVEDSVLSPVEKVLFAIIYCRKQGDECRLSVDELVRYVGVELKTLRESLQNLEQGEFIKIKDDCQINDATSFLSCAVLPDRLKAEGPDVPRP